jgi:ABC-type Fe3+ transport system permease subunit
MLVLVFIWMTSAFLVEKCWGDQTQGWQSVLKTVKSTVTVHLVWHTFYVAAETGGQMQAVVFYCMCLHKSACEKVKDLCRSAWILPQYFLCVAQTC